MSVIRRIASRAWRFMDWRLRSMAVPIVPRSVSACSGLVRTSTAPAFIPTLSKTSFNRASDVFVASNGDIFVADGYENHRIVQFDKDGKFIKIIGGVKGRGPGQLDDAGAKAVVFHALLALVDPDDAVIVPAPAWPSYGSMVTVAGARMLIEFGMR